MIDWENPYDYVSAGELREVGEEEHYYLAKRLLQAYPELFVAPSVSNEYIIRTTQVPRYIINDDYLCGHHKLTT